jgi:hypothetical protein
MKKKKLTIEFVNDKNKCNQLFDSVPDNLKPSWLVLLLTYFDYYLQETPDVVKELIDIIDKEEKWYKAKDQAKIISVYRAETNDKSLEKYLLFAEKIAILTDNILMNEILLDDNLGFKFVQLANESAQTCTEDHFIIYDLEVGFTLFEYQDELKELIQTSNDFRLFRKIDNVLWRDWDPLDLNKNWLRHEYLSYIPKIFNLIKSKEYIEIIAQHIYELENDFFEYHHSSFDRLIKLVQKMKN